MSRAVLLSVQPRYARALLDGTKTAEVRRQFPHLQGGTTVYIYSSTPDRCVLGTVTVQRTVRLSIGEVWGRYGRVIDIEPGALGSYLDGAKCANVLEVVRPIRWADPISLATLRDEIGLEPAQSFRYVVPESIEALRTTEMRAVREPATPRRRRQLPATAAAIV